MLKKVQDHLGANWQNLLLSTLAGIVLATGLTKLFSAEQTFGLSFSIWQLAMLYFFCITGSVMAALKLFSGRKNDSDATNQGDIAKVS